jgi:hypothetical protein
MSQQELNQVNKVYHAIVLVLSIACVIAAICSNPNYMILGSIIYVLGMESNFKNADADKTL